MTCDAYCRGCYYYGPAHQTCDYWEKADELRGCPAGTGCDKKITEKEYKMAIKSNRIDKEAAYKLWQEGKTDKEIAEVFGVTVQAVRTMRRKYWEEPAAGAAEPVPDAAEEPVVVCEAAELEDDDSKVMIRALELLTGHLKGMDAVMTAQIVTTLWGWSGKEDLLEARNCLDYLIGKARAT